MIAIRIKAPADIYTPPLSFFLIEFVSLRSSLFSDLLIPDLSVALISCNRVVSVFVSAALMVAAVEVEVGVLLSIVVAFKGVNIQANRRTVERILIVSFFILFYFMSEVISTAQR